MPVMPRAVATAFAALVLAAPMAVAQSTQPGDTQASGATTSAQTELRSGQMRISEYFDKEIYSRDGNEIGEVVDLIVEGNRITAAVVEVERQLGVGERYVAVPVERLQRGDDRFTVDMSREDVKALPAFKLND